MKTHSSPTAQTSSTNLQEAMRALSEQVSAAVSAIAERDLDHLEQSLWQQQVLCAGLQKLFTHSSLDGMNANAEAQFKDIAAQLFRTNAIYTQLIQQAERTGQALYQLCLEHGSTTWEGPSLLGRSLEA